MGGFSEPVGVRQLPVPNGNYKSADTGVCGAFWPGIDVISWGWRPREKDCQEGVREAYRTAN